jgi:transposase-like protein
MIVPFPHDSASLSARQLRAIEALVDGKTNAQAAQRAGVNVSTLYRWRTESAPFMAALKDAQNAAFGEGIEALRRGVKTAVRTCETLMRGNQPPMVRVRAATALLAHALRANDVVSVEERLRALEERIR